MLTNAALFEREFRRLIDEEIERLKDILTTVPDNVSGPGSVSYLQGGIAALRGINDLISAAKELSDQRSR